MKRFFTILLSVTVSLDSWAQFGNLLKGSGGTSKKEGQIIYTHDEYDNLEAATPHALTEIKDGEKLWMYVKLLKPIGNYVNVQKFTDKEGYLVENVSFMIVFSSRGNSFGKFSEQPVFVKGGEKAEGGMVMNKGYVAYLDNINPEQTTEFKMCLSNYIRHKSSFVFLKAVGGGDAGKWDSEIRLKGKNDEVFARGGILTNVEAGVAGYRKAWKAYETITEKGDIADNVLPPTGKFNDAAVKAAVSKEAKTTGITTQKVVFTQDAWSETVTQDIYKQKKRIIHGYLTYKQGTQCMYAMAEITQNLTSGSWGPSLVRLYDTDSPVHCDLIK